MKKVWWYWNTNRYFKTDNSNFNGLVSQKNILKTQEWKFIGIYKYLINKFSYTFYNSFDKKNSNDNNIYSKDNNQYIKKENLNKKHLFQTYLSWSD